MSERAAAAIGLVLTSAAALVCVSLTMPPEPRFLEPATATSFSASRAMTHVRALAGDSRAAGTTAHREAQAYVTSELESLGLEVEWQEASVAVQRGSGLIVGGRITNVLARSKGPVGDGVEPGAVALLAHYDSRPNTPGAADDASGVAIVLEAMRVLVEDDGVVRPVMAIITDLEEIGLLGARAFVEGHRWRGEIGALINVEARGGSGPSIMFETTPGNLPLAEAYRAAVPYPVSNSLSYEVYRRMPNDSDFTVFKDFVPAGFNFAFIGDHPRYHTRLDTIARLDQRSLYQQGANVTELARYLAASERLLRSGEDGVYFSLPRAGMSVYPARVAGTLSLALGLLAAVALWRMRGGRSGEQVWSLSAALRGAGLAVAIVAGGFVIAQALWEVLALGGRPLLGGPHGRPHGTPWFGTAVAFAVILWAALVARRWVPFERRLGALAGALLVWTAGAVALSWTVVGASYLLVWPAVSGWIGWWLIARAGGAARPVALQLVTAIAALPAVALLVPTAVLFLDALTLSGAGVPAGLVGLLLTLLMPQLSALAEVRAVKWSLSAGLLACLAVGVALSLPTAERPHVNSLFYVADGPDCFWFSLDDTTDEWTAGVLGERPELLDAPPELFLGGRSVLRSTAPALGLVEPVVEPVDSEILSARAFELRPGSSGQVLRLRASSAGRVTRVSVDGAQFAVATDAEEALMTLLGPPDAAWRIEVELEDPAAPIDLEILEQRYGLPEGIVAARPAHLIPSSSWRTDSAFVVGRARL